MTATQKLICVGRIRAPHGVRGLVNVESYTEEPTALFSYPQLWLKDQKSIALNLKGNGARGCFLAAIDQITTRDEARNFTGNFLYIVRGDLPDSEEDDVYIADLVGLKAVLETGEFYGTVSNTPDYGGGILIEIQREGAEEAVLIPFTVVHIPHIDLEAGSLTVCPPHFVEDFNENWEARSPSKSSKA